MTIPSKSSVNMKPTLVSVSCNYIFNCPCEYMSIVRQSSCKRRSIIESKSVRDNKNVLSYFKTDSKNSGQHFPIDGSCNSGVFREKKSSETRKFRYNWLGFYCRSWLPKKVIIVELERPPVGHPFFIY